jgi:NDP-sugar pyrophosphorylase family protein
MLLDINSTAPVVILAGGKGTRIRALFPDVPKPLIPIKNKPFLDWQIELLRAQGFHDFVLCTGYLSDQIRDYFGDGSSRMININYSEETQPLGTAGAIKNAASYFFQTTLILNGDTYLITDYQSLFERHQQLVRQYGAIASLILVQRSDTERYGSVLLDVNSVVTGFQEKSVASGAGLVNAGAYFIEPAFLNFIPPYQNVSLENDIFPQAISDDLGLYGIQIDASFIDMGTSAGLDELANTLRLN